MRNAPPTAARGGFVLVATLAMLVILSLLAGTIALVTQRLRDSQLERQRLLDDEIAMASTRASVLYLLATQRMTLGGLTIDDRVVLSQDEREMAGRGDIGEVRLTPVGNELRLDGSAYRGLAQVRFSLQDDRGLIAVNWSAPALLQGWIEQLAAPGSAAPPLATLSNLLLDYQDPDDLYRINSAEAEGYRKAGLQPPGNHTLASPLELRRVLGWRTLLAGIDDNTLAGTVTTARSPLLNVNTAPVQVLDSLPGVDAAMAARVVAARTLQPFTRMPEFHGLLGAIPLGEDALSLYPSASGTLRLWPARGGAVQLVHWTLTPFEDGGRPWREDYEFSLPQDPGLAGAAARTVATPVFAEQVPAPD